MGKQLGKSVNRSTSRETVMKNVDLRALSLSVLLLGPPTNYYLNTILRYGFGMQSISMYVYIVIALFGLYSYRYFNKLDRASILLFAFLVLGFLIAGIIGGTNILITSDFNPLESPLLQVFLYCFPLYILTKTCVDFQKALVCLYYFAFFNLILFIPSYYFSQQYLSAMNVDYMSISYNVLVALCICLGYSWNRRKLLSGLVAIASLLLLIVVGSRGASLSALMFIIILMIVKILEGEKKRVLKVSLIAIVLMTALGGYYFSEVSGLINRGDLYSRNLTKLDNNSFFSHDDRDEIKKVIESGLEKNFLGYGLLGDRIIMQKEHYEGLYAHNILLELRADFGVILGPIIFAILLVKLIISFFRLRGYKRDFLVMMIPAGFIKLWFSGSFLITPEFFCLLALLDNNRIRTRTQRVIEFANRRKQ